MKSFAFLMSIYLLVLSLIPCGDILECDALNGDMISVTKDHHQDEHHLEHCTPFCACACSSGFYHVVQQMPQQMSYSIHSAKSVRYSSACTAGVSFSIWQPPKLG